MMDSVRYLSYHQWRARKDEGVKPLQYHDKLLANVECLQDNVASIDRHIKDYLDVTKSFCGAGSHLAEAFCLVLNDTPLSEITQQLKQVVEEIEHVAHKSSLHIMNHILCTLCEFTATFPDLKRAIEAHKRSAQNYEVCQENIEALDLDETLSESSKRFKIAKKRFRSADEELSSEEEILYRSFTEVEENRVKMLGSCLLSLLQVQSQFLTSSSDLMSPVGSFQEIGDYLRDREVTLALKDATTAWLSLAQANQGLRQGKGLTRYDVHLLTHSNDEDLSESERKQLAIRVELLLKNYHKEFQRAPTPEADIPGGFQKHPKGVELALRGCCSETEAMAAGGQLELVSKEEMEAEILRHLPKLQLKIGSVVHETCASPSKAPDNLKSKLHCIRELVNSVAAHNDIPLNKETLDQFITTVLYEACSPVCVSSAKTAVHLLFGRANLVTIKPCKEGNTWQAQVFVKSTSVHVEVLSTWSVTADQTLFLCLSHDLDLNATLGTVDASCVSKFSLMDFLEDKERPLPTIYIKKHNTSQSPSTQPKPGSSPSHKQNRFRKSLTKATSKIFSRKLILGTKQSGNSTAFLESPTSSAPSAGTSSGSPRNEGYRMSFTTSSTETSNDHDVDIDSIAPLPPPRPKHWARKVRQQNLGEEDKTEADEEKCEENRDDWYSTDSKFPLPKLKPTLSDSQSQLSVASQQELDEVIKFLSGTPLKHRISCHSDNVDNSSHITPADSGLGSSLSIALSTVAQPSTVAGADSHDIPSVPSIITTTGSPAETTKEVKKETKSRKGKNSNKQDSDTKKESNKGEFSKGKKTSKKADKSTNGKGQDSGSKSDVQLKDKQSSAKGVVSPNESQGQVESKEKVEEVKEEKASVVQDKACPNPVVVTVSSVDDEQDEQSKVSISESLRSVWENADPSKKQNGSAVAMQLRKEKHGSQETLYHSCWSLSDFNDKGHKDEDTRSLNESLLPSNASPVMDLGLKWSIGFSNDVWSSNVDESNEMETGQWCRSDESLDQTTLGGKNAFSLGLGITGPELFAAASQAGRGDIGKGLAVLDMSKPWSTEDLTSKVLSLDPWPRRSTSPSQQPQWSKSTSLTDETQRQTIQRQTLPPQHYSDSFLPQEHWWNQAGPGLPHPSHPRYQQYLQRQYSVDISFQPMQGNARGGYSQVGLSAFHPVQPRFPKPTRPAHLQVPSQYPNNGNGNHHNSNPRF
ncbi:hypothetical protein QZH41_013592 [Actinostola sp. cb2023]|nr:hypothetical protein QZH41_013592 [Actinostola sp. cb2023]